MKNKLNLMLKAFGKEVLRANSFNNCYFDMKYRNERNTEWEKVYKISPAFFSLAIKGLQTEAFMAISRMYEPYGRADYNLYKLISFIESNSKQIDEENYNALNQKICLIKTELEEKQKIANKVIYFRDKVIAHNGKEHFLEVENKNYTDGISYEESKELLNFAGRIINDICCTVFNYTTVLTYSNGWYNTGHDVDNLMEFCLKHLNC